MLWAGGLCRPLPWRQLIPALVLKQGTNPAALGIGLGQRSQWQVLRERLLR